MEMTRYKTSSRVSRFLRTYLSDLFDSVQKSALLPIPLRPSILSLCGVSLGGGCHINPGVRFHRFNVTLGNGVRINNSVVLDASGLIVIGDQVGLGIGCQILSATHAVQDRLFRRDPLQVDLMKTTIERGCWIGAGARVLPGVTVGEGCVVAAGAVVTKDCAPNGLYAGVPARRVKDLPH